MEIICKNDIDALKALEQKGKKERLSIEEYRQILGYRFSLGLLPDYVYWNEQSV